MNLRERLRQTADRAAQPIRRVSLDMKQAIAAEKAQSQAAYEAHAVHTISALYVDPEFSALGIKQELNQTVSNYPTLPLSMRDHYRKLASVRSYEVADKLLGEDVANMLSRIDPQKQTEIERRALEDALVTLQASLENQRIDINQREFATRRMSQITARLESIARENSPRS